MQVNSIKVKLLSVAVVAGLLTACGGGGSESDVEPSPTTRTGVVVDGVLSDATLAFADCANKTTRTDSKGSFSYPSDCTSSGIEATGGIDQDTGLTNTTALSTPKTASGFSVVSPLTTLLTTEAINTQQLVNALGLDASTNILQADPSQNRKLLAVGSAIQELVEGIHEAADTAGFTVNTNSIFEVVAAQLKERQSSIDWTNVNGNDFINHVAKAVILKADPSKTTEADNFAALIAQTVAENVQNVKVNAENLNKALLIAAKENTQQQTITAMFAPLLSQSGLLQNTAVIDLVNAIRSGNQVQIEINIDSLAAQGWNLNTYRIRQVTVGGIDYPLSGLQGKTLPVKNIADILIDVTGLKDGKYTAKAQLDFRTDKESATLTVDRLDVEFKAGQLVGAIIPAGTQPKVSSSNSKAGIEAELNVAKDVNALVNGKLALNTNILKQISPKLTNYLQTNYNVAGQEAEISAKLSLANVTRNTTVKVKVQ